MSEPTIILTEPLYDRRDPNRPPVFIAAAGATVPASVAKALGVSVPAAAKAVKVYDTENKAVKPAAKRAAKD